MSTRAYWGFCYERWRLKPERGAALARAVLVSLEQWRAELAAIEAAPGSEMGKRHLLASLGQAHLSLRQIMQRDSTSETS